VASVDYHLAPEHKFPQAVDDAVNAGLWACDNAPAVGADPDKIVLAGDSAGATLAAVVALAARDAGRPHFLSQLLIYPATDLSMSHPSHQSFGDGYRLTRSLMLWSSANYLREGRDIMDPRASPLIAGDHSGLPPAIIVTAEFDPLRDEGAAYASRLRDAGVDVQYRCFSGLIHGFINLTGAVESAKRALDEIAAMLKNHL
ncbi:MAG: alpha/beta hydrolase, partial [Gammaproteobacteria bacterium]